ncbi:MAG: transporter, family, multidrug resistance protein [Trichococcus sp.]|nr:transporter, family, multidrug resistance protein [Trichococcus sp.]
MATTFSKNIRSTLVSSFINSLIYSCTIPFLVIYLAGIFNPQITGMLVMTNVVVCFLAGIIGGYLADNFQRKKILYLFQSLYGGSLLLIALRFLGLLSADGWLILGYLVCGISFNLYSPAYDAVLMDCTTVENRKQAYQWQYWTFNLSMALGFSLGGFLFQHYLFQLFLVAGIAQLVMALLFRSQLDYTNTTAEKRHKNRLKDLFLNYRIAAKDTRWLFLILGMALFNTAEFSLKTYTAVRLSKEFETLTIFAVPIDGVRMLSLLQVLNTLLVVGFTFLVSRFTEKRSEKATILYGLLIYVVSYGLIAVMNNIYVLIPLMILATIGELASSPNINARKVDLVPEDKQASYLAFSSLSYQGADLLAAFALTLSGYISAGFIAGYIIILGLIGTSLTVSSLYGRNNKIR